MGSEYVILNPQEKNPGWVDSLRMECAPSLTETAPPDPSAAASRVTCKLMGRTAIR